jgi:dethiobiotin synthetase
VTVARKTVIAVTGTDTEVGKTVVTAALAAVQLSLGRTVAVVKPAQTGIGPDEDGDLAEVRRLAGQVATYEGVRLPQPLAPETAARLAGQDLPGLIEQRTLVEGVASAHDVTLVEGSGGVLVNLGENWNLVDLADSLRYAGHPVGFVVVARAGLGTLNHATLTVQAIQSRGLEAFGVVVGSWPEHPGLAEEQNLLDLPVMTGVPLLGTVPEGAAALPVRAFRRGALDWVPAL